MGQRNDIDVVSALVDKFMDGASRSELRQIHDAGARRYPLQKYMEFQYPLGRKRNAAK